MKFTRLDQRVIEALDTSLSYNLGERDTVLVHRQMLPWFSDCLDKDNRLKHISVTGFQWAFVTTEKKNDK